MSASHTPHEQSGSQISRRRPADLEERPVEITRVIVLFQNFTIVETLAGKAF